MNKQQWAFAGGVILVLVLIVASIVIIFGIFQRTLEQVMTPVEQANQQLTKISEFLRPTPTIIPDPITIIHEVRALSRLETIQYSVEKIITAENRQGDLAFLFGDRLLFVAHGTVIAGVDLGKVRPEDIWLEGDVLFIRMPQPEVFIATLDNEKSYVYDRDTGLLTRGDIHLETSARQVAEKEIMKAAIEDGILKQAGENAEMFLTRLFLKLGYQEVVFSQKSDSGT
ncbi:MAG: DUF4230 domain-containing protein [Anaerolineae bacterium]|nr:DUF4230 domain-containing protein [Anaerolineae bacterium]